MVSQPKTLIQIKTVELLTTFISAGFAITFLDRSPLLLLDKNRSAISTRKSAHRMDTLSLKPKLRNQVPYSLALRAWIASSTFSGFQRFPGQTSSKRPSGPTSRVLKS